MLTDVEKRNYGILRNLTFTVLTFVRLFSNEAPFSEKPHSFALFKLRSACFDVLKILKKNEEL